MLSPEGRCKTLDAAADGYVRGEGCGVLYLTAEEDKRHRSAASVAAGSPSNTDQKKTLNQNTKLRAYPIYMLIRWSDRSMVCI